MELHIDYEIEYNSFLHKWNLTIMTDKFKIIFDENGVKELKEVIRDFDETVEGH